MMRRAYGDDAGSIYRRVFIFLRFQMSTYRASG